MRLALLGRPKAGLRGRREKGAAYVRNGVAPGRHGCAVCAPIGASRPGQRSPRRNADLRVRYSYLRQGRANTIKLSERGSYSSVARVSTKCTYKFEKGLCAECVR